MIWVGIVDADVGFRNNFEEVILNLDEVKCKFSVSDLTQLEEMIEKESILNILFLGVNEDGFQELSRINEIKKEYSWLEVVLMTSSFRPELIQPAFESRITGFLTKPIDLDKIQETIAILEQGGAPISPLVARHLIDTIFFKKKLPTALQNSGLLTAKEKEVVSTLVDGLSYKNIAHRLGISIETVRFHIKNIYQKLEVHSKIEVVSKSFKGEI